VDSKYIPKYIQKDATLHSLFISGNCSTYFGWYFHPSSGAHTTVSTASGIYHTVTAICRYRGRVGTGLSVLWVAYVTHDLNDNLTRKEASISYITILLLPYKEHSVLPLERSSISLLSLGICSTYFLL
jgi:hypothetical protein